MVEVRGRMIMVDTPGGPSDCYVAEPADEVPRPGVLAYMDVFGLRPTFLRMVERLAGHGYVVLAPNVFHRHGRSPAGPGPNLLDPAQRAGELERVLPMLRALRPAEVMADTGAWLRALSGRPGVRPGPAGLVGYCMGGMLALRAAAAYPDQVAAVASFHGGDLATDAPDSPHLGLPRVQAELYFAHADNDPSAPPEQRARLEAALATAGLTYRSELYPGCAHGFTQVDSAAYDPDATARHWRELVALLDRVLRRA